MSGTCQCQSCGNPGGVINFTTDTGMRTGPIQCPHGCGHVFFSSCICWYYSHFAYSELRELLSHHYHNLNVILLKIGKRKICFAQIRVVLELNLIFLIIIYLWTPFKRNLNLTKKTDFCKATVCKLNY